MKIARLLLFPFGIFYGCIMAFRNKLFDWGILDSKNTLIKSIGVGNLAMGGTGKSVLVMYLIKMLKDHRIATLSRGYGRKTSGLIIAGSKDNPTSLYGIGKYGSDAYYLFCTDEWEHVKPKDYALKLYQEWLFKEKANEHICA